LRAADLFPSRLELRAGTMQAVRRLPEAHLEWRPPGGVHSILGWLRHLAQVEDWWVRAVIEGRTGFSPRGRLVDRESVLTYLEETRVATEGLLQEWPVERLTETRVIPAGGPRGLHQGQAVTLHRVFDSIFGHEAHHRGQIYLYLRLMGIEPPSF